MVTHTKHITDIYQINTFFYRKFLGTWLYILLRPVASPSHPLRPVASSSHPLRPVAPPSQLQLNPQKDQRVLRTRTKNLGL